MNRVHARIFLMCLPLLSVVSITIAQAAPVVEECVDLDDVWSGHPVNFALLTHGDRQYAAYYDAERRMIAASRPLGSMDWTRTVLPETVKWDSHNYITLTMDDNGDLHLSGNMHTAPIVYFRTRTPGDIATLERMPMTGERENKTTYPSFIRGPANEFIFTYRDGSSGNGDQIYNIYDHAAKTWKRLLDTPLYSGEGKMNAYPTGFVRGPDGYFHVCWVWRDHGGCETNHDISYARSKDLTHWETSGGQPLALPITLATGDIVDPVPAKGGAINGNTRIGFDNQGRVIVSYIKYDENGITQAYNARREEGKWVISKTSAWDYRWEFSGGGSIPFEITVSGVSPLGDGLLRQDYSHKTLGGGSWKLDEATLAIAGAYEPAPIYPPELSAVHNPYPGMEPRRAGDSGDSGEKGVFYLLQWDTLGANRDRPREGDPPPPSRLRVYKARR